MKDKKQYGYLNDLNLKVIIALSRSNNSIYKKSNILFKSHGLTTMQFAVLEVLYHKGDLKIGEIIDKILSTGGNMTVVIQNLLKEELIEKINFPEDHRVSIIRITQQGKDKIEEIFPKHLLQLEGMLQNLTPEEKETLISLLKKLNQ